MYIQERSDHKQVQGQNLSSGPMNPCIFHAAEFSTAGVSCCFALISQNGSSSTVLSISFAVQAIWR